MIKQFLINTYKRRLEYELNDIDIKNLEDYTIGSNTGCELSNFYKKIIEATIGEIVTVVSDEISDGKYEIVFLMTNGKGYSSISKAWYTKEYVLDTIMDVLLDYFKDMWEHRKSEIINSKSMQPCY